MRPTFVILAACVLLCANAHAQSARQTDVPRLANGKPNFSGVWQALTTANWDVLTHGASAGPPEYGALLATPPGYGIVDGDEIPYLPAAAEQQRRNYANRFKDDPELKCYMPGVPRANYMPYPLQIALYPRESATCSVAYGRLKPGLKITIYVRWHRPTGDRRMRHLRGADLLPAFEAGQPQHCPPRGIL
jgi:hypothetical protein